MNTSEKRHLHPAVVHLLLAGFSAICFVILAINIQSGLPITNFDKRYSIQIHDYSVSHPDVWNFAECVTDLGSGRPRTVVIVGVAIILVAFGQCRLALLWGATQWLLKEVVAYSKDIFERARPQFEVQSYYVGGWSFPSGHATGAMATYGMIAFFVAWRWAGRWYSFIAIGILAAIILAVGLSRMLLGVHFFTDILGGYLLGLAWVSLCVAVIEWQRAKKPDAIG